MVLENSNNLSHRLSSIQAMLAIQVHGQVAAMAGLTIEVSDFSVPVGALCTITTRANETIEAEVIGFREKLTVLMPLSENKGVSPGDDVRCGQAQPSVPIGPHLLGRVINGRGEPIDGKGPLLCQTRRVINAAHLTPMDRTRLDTPLGTGVRAIDAMLTCARGQRLGIFSGPGVGKSVLLGTIARHTAADISVIALIGERGREVREFIEKDLGPEGLARSVVVVSTSDEPPPIRVRASFLATTIAEYFRDQGNDILFLMDSITRLAMAQRQIGLSMGEPPATKGYTPSVFSLLPQIVERCGKNPSGSITGFFTVLVEGDDLTEPISDAMRGLLDGHLWLSRELANRGHYPAIDILESISRVMVDIVEPEQMQNVNDIKRLIAVYRDIEDLVNIGAYSPGSNPQFDLAVNAYPVINNFLQQGLHEGIEYSQAILDMNEMIESFRAALPTQAGVNSTPSETAKTPVNSLGMDRMMAGL
jgi:flagellum-specific ATP synthase